jgi:hypothetical protein
MLIEEEDGNAGGGNELIDLRSVCTKFRSGVAVDRCLTYSMRFIQNEHVEAVPFGGHELIEVLEYLLNAWSAVTGHFAQRLGEGA